MERGGRRARGERARDFQATTVQASRPLAQASGFAVASSFQIVVMVRGVSFARLSPLAKGRIIGQREKGAS